MAGRRQAVIALFLHLLSTTTTLETARQLLTRHSPRTVKSYGSHFQFLTVIALFLSLLTFAIALAHSVCLITGPVHSSLLRHARRAVRFIATPIELTIVAVYWPLYALDAGLLVEGRTLPPISLDVGLHLLPAVFLVLDFVVLPPERRYRLDSWLTLLCFASFLGVYTAWLAECRRRNGFWAYPVLERLSTEVMAFTFIAGVGVLGGAREVVLKLSLAD